MKELPFHVSEHAWAVHEKWLTVGLEVLSRALGDTYELLVPAGWSRGAAVGDYIMHVIPGGSGMEYRSYARVEGCWWERSHPAWVGALLDGAQ